MKDLYGFDEKQVLLLNKLELPKLSNKELKELYQKIKPIITKGNLKYSLKEYNLEELRKLSYTTNPDTRELIDAFNITPVADFYCLHPWAYYTLFKPTIAEVLAQIPSDLVDEVNAFEIIESPHKKEDIYKYKEVFNKGYHLSKVRTYKLHK